MTKNFDERDKKYIRLIILLTTMLIALVIFSFGAGRYKISSSEIFSSIYKKISNIEFEDKTIEAVLFHVRLPRIVFSILVGSSLSVAGAFYQGVFKNPLVSSDVIVASSGAAFGAALGILLGFSSAAISISAFFWSIFAVTIVYFNSR